MLTVVTVGVGASRSLIPCLDGEKGVQRLRERDDVHQPNKQSRQLSRLRVRAHFIFISAIDPSKPPQAVGGAVGKNSLSLPTGKEPFRFETGSKTRSLLQLASSSSPATTSWFPTPAELARHLTAKPLTTALRTHVSRERCLQTGLYRARTTSSSPRASTLDIIHSCAACTFESNPEQPAPGMNSTRLH
jgi:hypothetical protein